MIRAWLVALALAGSGCTYTIAVSSRPTGALMDLPNGDTVVLPQDVALRWRPFVRQTLVITSPGYREMEVRVSRRLIRELDFATDPVDSPAEAFGSRPRKELEIILVPEHGPSGTWEEEDVTE